MLNIEKLVKDFEYSGKFLDSDDLMNLFSWMAFENFKELDDYLNDNDYRFIGDRIAELSEAKINAYHDAYYYDLRVWAVDNYKYIAMAMEESEGDTKNPDFHKMIQSGQYLACSNEFHAMVSDFSQYLDEIYKLDEMYKVE